MTESTLNPYESPREASAPRQLDARTELMWRLRGPSIGLLVLSGLQAGTVLLALLTTLLLLMRVPSALWSKALTMDFAFGVLWFVPSALIFAAAIRMRQMRSLWFCRVIAVLSCVPFFSPFIFVGIPLGIWASIVLFLPTTAAQFDRPPVATEEEEG